MRRAVFFEIYVLLRHEHLSDIHGLIPKTSSKESDFKEIPPRPWERGMSADRMTGGEASEEKKEDDKDLLPEQY